MEALCSCVAMLVISMWLRCTHGFALWAPELGLPYWWTLFAGVIYAIGMMSIMKAWEHVPSTVVTPMLQMSGPAVEVMEALLGHNASSAHWMLAPLANSSLTLTDAAAFVFIVTGGLLRLDERVRLALLAFAVAPTCANLERQENSRRFAALSARRRRPFPFLSPPALSPLSLPNPSARPTRPRFCCSRPWRGARASPVLMSVCVASPLDAHGASRRCSSCAFPTLRRS